METIHFKSKTGEPIEIMLTTLNTKHESGVDEIDIFMFSEGIRLVKIRFFNDEIRVIIPEDLLKSEV